MSSFKQKLKSILNDSSSIKNTSNINEQQFDQFLLKTYRKIKRDNTPQSITSRINNTPNYSNKKKTRTLFFESSKNINKYTKYISSNTAERMSQTISLIKNQNYNNKYDIFFNKINKCLNKNSKMKRKIQRDYEYIIKDNNNNNNRRFNIINRPKYVFHNNTINNEYFYKNKNIIDMRAIFENNKENLKINKRKRKNEVYNQYNFKKGKLDFGNFFNQFSNKQKYINFNF